MDPALALALALLLGGGLCRPPADNTTHYAALADVIGQLNAGGLQPLAPGADRGKVLHIMSLVPRGGNKGPLAIIVAPAKVPGGYHRYDPLKPYTIDQYQENDEIDHVSESGLDQDQQTYDLADAMSVLDINDADTDIDATYDDQSLHNVGQMIMKDLENNSSELSIENTSSIKAIYVDRDDKTTENLELTSDRIDNVSAIFNNQEIVEEVHKMTQAEDLYDDNVYFYKEVRLDNDSDSSTTGSEEYEIRINEASLSKETLDQPQVAKYTVDLTEVAVDEVDDNLAKSVYPENVQKNDEPVNDSYSDHSVESELGFNVSRVLKKSEAKLEDSETTMASTSIQSEELNDVTIKVDDLATSEDSTLVDKEVIPYEAVEKPDVLEDGAYSEDDFAPTLNIETSQETNEYDRVVAEIASGVFRRNYEPESEKPEYPTAKPYFVDSVALRKITDECARDGELKEERDGKYDTKTINLSFVFNK